MEMCCGHGFDAAICTDGEGRIEQVGGSTCNPGCEVTWLLWEGGRRMAMLHGVMGWRCLCGMDVREVHDGRWYGVLGA
jgi:hypothetical protein